MSLLEDVFLEDEAGEAQELERVIEGDEFDDRPAPHSDEDSNDNSEKEDEAEEDKRRVDPTSAKTKRISKNPRVTLNPARLTGPRGIQVIPDHFKDFKFKGKGHEKEDLDLVLKKMEHWAYRLYPKFQFEDCLKKIETLGKKRPVTVHLHKIRSDQYISDDVVIQKDSSDDEAQPAPEEDEFDKLLQQQIELARATPAPSSAKKGFGTPRVDTPSFSMPKATSSPSISEEQKERMLRNRRMAEERRLARLKNAEQNISVINEEPIEIESQHNHSHIGRSENATIINEVPFDVEDSQNDFNEPRKKQNRSNVIESSDEDCEELVVNKSITVDVHETGTNSDENTEENLNRLVEAKKHNRSNIFDSSDEEIDDNENVTEVNESIKNKSNIIDSEEESDEVAVEISSGIQDKQNNFNCSNKSQSEVMTIDEERDVEVTKPNSTDSQNDTQNNITTDTLQNEQINTDTSFNKQRDRKIALDVADGNVTDIVDNFSKDSNSDINNCDKNNIATEELKNFNTTEISPSHNKENIENNIELELMDVDFNEDF